MAWFISEFPIVRETYPSLRSSRWWYPTENDGISYIPPRRGDEDFDIVLIGALHGLNKYADPDCIYGEYKAIVDNNEFCFQIPQFKKYLF